MTSVNEQLSILPIGLIESCNITSKLMLGQGFPEPYVRALAWLETAHSASSSVSLGSQSAPSPAATRASE